MKSAESAIHDVPRIIASGVGGKASKGITKGGFPMTIA